MSLAMYALLLCLCVTVVWVLVGRGPLPHEPGQSPFRDDGASVLHSAGPWSMERGQRCVSCGCQLVEQPAGEGVGRGYSPPRSFAEGATILAHGRAMRCLMHVTGEFDPADDWWPCTKALADVIKARGRL